MGPRKPTRQNITVETTFYVVQTEINIRALELIATCNDINFKTAKATARQLQVFVVFHNCFAVAISVCLVEGIRDWYLIYMNWLFDIICMLIGSLVSMFRVVRYKKKKSMQEVSRIVVDFRSRAKTVDDRIEGDPETGENRTKHSSFTDMSNQFPTTITTPDVGIHFSSPVPTISGTILKSNPNSRISQKIMKSSCHGGSSYQDRRTSNVLDAVFDPNEGVWKVNGRALLPDLFQNL